MNGPLSVESLEICNLNRDIIIGPLQDIAQGCHPAFSLPGVLRMQMNLQVVLVGNSNHAVTINRKSVDFFVDIAIHVKDRIDTKSILKFFLKRSGYFHLIFKYLRNGAKPVGLADKAIKKTFQKNIHSLGTGIDNSGSLELWEKFGSGVDGHFKAIHNP